MNTGLKKASSGLFASGVLALAAVAGMANGASPAVNAASPVGVQQAQPQELWSNPIDVSRSGLYDNTPDIAASPLNGGVTIAWEQRDAGGGDNYLQETSNLSLGAPFGNPVTLAHADYKANGSPRMSSDFSGTRHITFWQQNGSIACDQYARILPDTTVAEHDFIAGACYGQKNVADVAGVDGVVHAIFGKDLANIGYYRREVSGAWSIINEPVPVVRAPKNIAIGVSSLGTVMVAYVDRGPAHTDIFTTIRNSNGSWTTPEDISSIVNPNASWGSAHLPNIDRDAQGGLRIVWSQATRNANDTTQDDVFTREWVPGTGWAGQNITQVTGNSGNSYAPDIAIDAYGQSHIIWQDDTGRSQSNFELFYARGRGTSFTTYTDVFPQFNGGYSKEAAVAVNPPIAGHPTGNVHVTFGSNINDSQKENYYAYADIMGGVPVPTATPTLSPTPAATATPCTAGTYSDVHSTDYFYQAVHSLALSGVISGYSDCTFRPYNNITRGQAAKIVVLAASTAIDTHGGPHFRDVPTTDPFYSYIETAYNNQIISGYSCGTNCLEFRPANNITRGQFSKMIVLAFNLPVNVAGGPHFTDVHVDNPFYHEIETAYNAGLISGYSDHTFRPNAAITRGQAAKIAWGARNLIAQTPTTTPTSLVLTETVTTTPVVTATETATEVAGTPIATVTETGTPTAAPSDTPTETDTVTPTTTP